MDKACFCVALSLGTPVYVTGIIVARLVNNNNWISVKWMSKDDSTDTEVYTMLIVFIIAGYHSFGHADISGSLLMIECHINR
jgi:hypothetical protein